MQHIILSISSAEICDMIDPADPDKVFLQDRLKGIWEARWMKRNDVDIQRLKQHPRIKLMSYPFGIEDLPGWTGIRFVVLSE